VGREEKSKRNSSIVFSGERWFPSSILIGPTFKGPALLPATAVSAWADLL